MRASLAVNAPLSSGMGRLFDAVAAVLGVRDRVTYEGQAAIELEQLAGYAEASRGRGASATTTGARRARRGRARSRAAARGDRRRVPRDDRRVGRRGGVRARATAADTVVLSGGSFQNRRLAASTRARLEAFGFRVLEHRLVPPNDGGISYGQAAVAARRLACA